MIRSDQKGAPADLEGAGGVNPALISTSPQIIKTGVELRFCTVCNIEQPLRSKHCRVCHKCVATYDHHCPWLGNCVGEKNRLHFYLFLVV